MSVIAQIVVIEKIAISDEWLTETSCKADNESAHVLDQNFNGIQLEATQVTEEEGSWSKSSSMSTINLRDQPIIFDEKNYNYHSVKKGLKGSITLQLLTSIQFMALMYQVFIVSTVIGTLLVNHLS